MDDFVDYILDFGYDTKNEDHGKEVADAINALKRKHFDEEVLHADHKALAKLDFRATNVGFFTHLVAICIVNEGLV
ncbi:hypothetical protein FRX31_012059 [Thalictrum thalictroides]|uniref:Uncharacterized protein n=1 Tax=Thalictrum thalictroides TaxID=46969 RepID=A0A7J6WLX1_THATH|nr:hypothetical protein FRX31_012059 [Thalictrum thalictroides]